MSAERQIRQLEPCSMIAFSSVAGAHSVALGPTMVVAVLIAAVLHATWNGIAHAIDDRLVGFALIGVVDIAVGATIVTATGLPPATAWPYILASAAVHVLYNLSLLAGYQLGEFSQVYPLARGIAPVIVVAVSLLVLDRELTVQELVGVGLMSVGLIGVVLVGGAARTDARAVCAAVGTGAMIATYTVVDGLGVARCPVLTYIGWMFLLQGPGLPAIAMWRRRRRFLRSMRRHLWPGLLGGAISLIAYSIVLWAQTSGSLAPVAALRESSIVFGALIGAIFLGERLGRRRAVMSVIVLGGVAVLSI